VKPTLQIDDAQIALAVEEYRELLKTGFKPDRQGFLDRYRDIAESLGECLDALEFIDKAAPQLQGTPLDGSRGRPASDVSLRPELPLGDFRIIREIGRGGMGVVYEAEQMTLGRRVALKVLPFASMLDAKQLRRFQNEAKAAAQMHHTHIVPVFGTGCERGVHYYAMQFINGRTLASLIQDLRESKIEDRELRNKDRGSRIEDRPKNEGECVPHAAHSTVEAREQITETTKAEFRSSILIPRSSLLFDPRSSFFGTVAQLGIQAGEALEYAHQMGIIHRDIKPANLIIESLAPSGDRGRSEAVARLWVTDFGLAHCQGGADLTITGDLVGTLRYMSPEQAMGGREPLDQRTDIYSLGVTLYELMTLEPAFPSRDRQELLRQIAFQEPPRPRRINPAVPRELETIVLKAIAKNSAERYATAQELADDLRRFLDDKPIRAKRATLVQRSAKWAKRNKVVVGAAIIVMVTILIAWMVVTLLIWREKNEVERQRDLAEAQRLRAVQGERAARRHLYAAQMHLAIQAAEKGSIAEVLELLEGLKPQDQQEDLRGFEWFYLWRLCHQGHLRTLRDRAGGTSCLAFAPDGKRIASGSANGTVMLWDMASPGSREVLSGHTAGIIGLAFSPDGRTLVTGSQDQTVKVWDLASGKERISIRDASGPLRCLALAPDGQKVATGGPDGAVRIWDLTTGRLLTTPPAQPDPVNALAFSPNGELLACAGGREFQPGRVKIWNAASLQEERVIHGHRSVIYALAFSPDGKSLATGSDDWHVKVWDVLSGEEKTTLEGPGSGAVQTVAYSPDGRKFAWGNAGGQVVLLDLATGQARLQGHSTSIFALHFSPDSKILASGSSSSIKLWSAEPVQESIPLETLSGEVVSLAISSDGNTLATGGRDGTAALWDLPEGQRRLTFRCHAGEVSAVAFAPSPSAGEGQAGGTLATAGKDGSVKLWDPLTGKANATLEGKSPVWSLAFSSDGLLLASGAQDGTIDLWNLSTRELSALLKGHAGRIQSLAFSPDGQTLASADQHGLVKLWDAVSGQQRSTLQTSGLAAYTLAFSPEGQTLACGSTGGTPNVRLWDVATAKPLTALKGHIFTTRTVAFFSDGKTLISGGSDKTIKIWDVVTGQERASFKVPGGYVASLVVSPDGRRVVTASLNGSVKLWSFGNAADVEAHEKGEPTSLWPMRKGGRIGNSSHVDHATIRTEELDFGRSRLGLARLELSQDPTGAEAQSDLAWALAENANPLLRDPQQAVQWARKAVEQEAHNAAYWRTLGVAHYRCGDWKSAVTALEKGMRLRRSDDSLGAFFLAMAFWQLGDQKKARERYDQARQWQEKGRPVDSDLSRVRAEAEALIAAR
jgi:WD40 repeat protein/serine/threonine protein kinase